MRERERERNMQQEKIFRLNGGPLDFWITTNVHIRMLIELVLELIINLRWYAEDSKSEVVHLYC